MEDGFGAEDEFLEPDIGPYAMEPAQVRYQRPLFSFYGSYFVG